MNQNSPIGIFDSGFGGISVVHTLIHSLPNEKILFFGDSKYNPYGTKTKEEITQRCIAICDEMMKQDVKAIVIACNTATSACVDRLRETYPVDIIGMEPALKVACEKGPSQKIAVWATQLTLKEEKFRRLMSHYEKQHTIHKIACPELVKMVEENRLDDSDRVQTVLEEYIGLAPDVDSIVLGCTHFVFYRKQLEHLLDRPVHIIDGNQGTVRHLADVLNQKGLLNPSNQPGEILWENSLPEKKELSKELLNRLEKEYECMGNV